MRRNTLTTNVGYITTEIGTDFKVSYDSVKNVQMIWPESEVGTLVSGGILATRVKLLGGQDLISAAALGAKMCQEATSERKLK